jgi:hypothetical protein
MTFKKGDIKPPGSGRTKGRTNKVTRDIKELAALHGPMAIERLAQLAASSDGRTAVAACKELLDRGFGRPSQALEVKGHGLAPGEIVLYLPDNGRNDPPR